jgi:putative oxidoreductase
MGLFDRDPDKGPKEKERNTGADQAEGIDADLFDQLDVPDAPDRVSDSVPDVPETSPEAATGSASAPASNAVPDAVPDAQHEEASDAEPDTTPTESTDSTDGGNRDNTVDSGDTDDGADSAEDDAVTPGTEAGAEDTKDTEAGADADVPAAPAAKRDIYDVVGRARPQRIEPRRPEPEPEPEPEPAPEPAADESATTAFSTSEDPVFSGDETAEKAEDYGNSDSSRDVRREPVPQSTASFDGDDPDTDSSDDQTTALLGTGAAAGAGVAAGAGAAGAAGAAQEEPSTETTTFPAEDPDYPVGGADADLDPDESAAESGDGEPVGRVSTDDPRRGTLDFGLLILRVVAGALLIIRGLQTLFAFGGDPGISALEQTLNAYSFADILAVAIPVAQVVGGGLLVFGLLTPIGGAVSLVVAGFLALHSLSLWDSGYWPYALSPAVQMWGLVAAISLVLIFTGPGRYSADISRGWATRPLASAWVFALIGLGATAGLWLAVGGGNPF